MGRAYLVLVALVVTAIGCAPPTTPEASGVRDAFPAYADAVLQASASFRAIDDAFAAPASPHGDARFPALAGAPVELDRAGGAPIRVTELDAVGDAVLAENALAYAGARRTSFWAADLDRYEEWLLLEPAAVRRDAPVAAWAIDGASLVEHGGEVDLHGASGEPRFRVTAPFAVAESGRRVDAHLGARAGRIELWIDADDERVLVDPGWKQLAPMNVGRTGHTATTLEDGTVLVVGGVGAATAVDDAGAPTGEVTAGAEIFDPALGAWTAVDSMAVPRWFHTATRLHDGSVLVVGGCSTMACDRADPAPSSAEIFEPATKTWRAVPSSAGLRSSHIAALLDDGRVLITGGFDLSTRLYDPARGEFFPASSPAAIGQFASATVLPDGRVVVIGGFGSAPETSVQVFDPATGRWTVGAVGSTRAYHTAALVPGEPPLVLVAGGLVPDGANPSNAYPALATAAEFDGANLLGLPPMARARLEHIAAPLPGGRVLVAGGIETAVPGVNVALAAAEIFDRASVAWQPAPRMNAPRVRFATAALADGRVLVSGGASELAFGALGSGVNVVGLDSAELYDTATPGWTAVSPMAASGSASVTPLEDGTALVVGSRAHQRGAELYNPKTRSFRLTGKTIFERSTTFIATRLSDGRVLVAGDGSAEIYDPASHDWTATGPMQIDRAECVAALLDDGRVLAAGGSVDLVEVATAEVYDPAKGTWRLTGLMKVPRKDSSVARLPSGEIMVSGGRVSTPTGVVSVADVEVYTPASDGWRRVESLGYSRSGHQSSVLRDGRVLVTGGAIEMPIVGPSPVSILASSLVSAEIFDSSSERWAEASPMLGARAYHAATVLPDGRVVVAGGLIGAIRTGNEITFPLTSPSSEMFDPASQTWTTLPPMTHATYSLGAAGLADGTILAVGGEDASGNATAAAEIFSLQPDGTGCTSAHDCASGHCADGVCCDTACDAGRCDTCTVAEHAVADGVCTQLKACGAYACIPAQGECVRPGACTSTADCGNGFACDASGDCVPPPPQASTVDDASCALPIRSGGSSQGEAELALLGLAALSSAGRRRRARRA